MQRTRWFGCGFNGFGQILVRDKTIEGDDGDTVDDIKVVKPTLLSHGVGSGCEQNTGEIRASWSRRASLHFDSFGLSSEGCGRRLSESRGFTDAVIGESYLILSFTGRVESWDLEADEKVLAWSMEINAECSEMPLNLPLVPGGYIATSPPFYHSLSPHLRAKNLALGAEHAILLSATGVVYTWGQGSHGQLGHGGLTSEDQPRAVEALWGMPMSCVATGAWHTVCIYGGDLYVWGWNESGQLGLPSQAIRQTQQQSFQQAGTVIKLSQDTTSSCRAPAEEEGHKEVFISIQAFPALLDITPSCDIRTVSCGSRHTAAVTTTGNLYTWGWGGYGQLGFQTSCSDEPRCVEFFREQHMSVVDVVCGAWNTFAAVVQEDIDDS
ncbi:RCC1 domain-containing protein 1 [Aulostomus maculatus]